MTGWAGDSSSSLPPPHFCVKSSEEAGESEVHVAGGSFFSTARSQRGGRGAFARELAWELLGEEDADRGRPEGSEARVVRPRNGQKGPACMSATEGSLLLWAGGCNSGRDAPHWKGSTKVKRIFLFDFIKKIHTVDIRMVTNNWSI